MLSSKKNAFDLNNSGIDNVNVYTDSKNNETR